MKLTIALIALLATLAFAKGIPLDRFGGYRAMPIPNDSGYLRM